MDTAEVLAWVQQALHLSEGAAGKVSNLFKVHGVNGSLLDFFVSNDGRDLLAKYTAECTSVCASVTASPQRAPTAAGASEVSEKENHGENLPSADDNAVVVNAANNAEQHVPNQATGNRKKTNLCAREKMPPEVRRSEGPYFRQRLAPDQSAVLSNHKKGTPKVPPTRALVKGGNPPDVLAREESGPHSQTSSNHGGNHCRGFLKSFNKEKGWGFITEDVNSEDQYKDVFVLKSEMPKDGMETKWEVGRPCEFELVMDGDRRQARKVCWLDDMKPRYIGNLKSLGDSFGFLQCLETHALYDRDVYVSRGDVPDGSRIGDALTFEVFVTAKGEPRARQVARPEGQRW
mmetsp:Transcript_25649/g.59765  ORF Transcript_25649/g.59765 Transcript_25649/m.59765 type:complete len:346 (-) Transcript_25649:41-1078(-)